MASINRILEDFEPSTEWASEEGHDTLLVFLPGFRKEEIKVQITSAQNLRITGERKVGDNQWSHFRKEFPISSNHDSHRISARFDNGILYIKHPKMIVPAEPLTVEEKEVKGKPMGETQKPPEAQKPPEPKSELQQPGRPDQKKEPKDSPKPLEPKTKPELQHPGKTDQRKETGEPPKPSRKPEPQTQKADKQKEPDQIPSKTGAEKQSIEKEHKPSELRGETAQISAPPDRDDASGTALQRKKKAEEKRAMDMTEKLERPSESVHGGERKMRKETRRHLGSTRSRNIESHLLTKLNKSIYLINLVVASFLVLALALYIKYKILARGTIQSENLEGPED